MDPGGQIRLSILSNGAGDDYACPEKKKGPEALVPEALEIWLPTVDTLRNFFFTPGVDMKLTMRRYAQIQMMV